MSSISFGKTAITKQMQVNGAVVALQRGMGHANMGALMKFFLVTLIALPAIFAVGSALRRVPLARSVL
jgi:hypothetical protein